MFLKEEFIYEKNFYKIFIFFRSTDRCRNLEIVKNLELIYYNTKLK